MQRLEARTTVYASQAEAFALLRRFEAYPRYTEYLAAVERREAGAVEQRGAGADELDGDAPETPTGDVGPAYALRFEWWRLGHTLHSRVTAVVAPEQIAWTLTDDVTASGRWELADVPVPADAPTGVEEATEIRLVVEYDPSSVGRDVLDLPLLVDLSWLIERVQALVREEGERVVERVVTELEGEPRPVELTLRVVDDVSDRGDAAAGTS